jgi:hypothetical protein
MAPWLIRFTANPYTSSSTWTMAPTTSQATSAPYVPHWCTRREFCATRMACMLSCSSRLHPGRTAAATGSLTSGEGYSASQWT